MQAMERKVATVLFADLVDSTGLVSSVDPEVVRQRVNRYFEVVSGRIEAHGGTVEKFAGDAVMAAFGVPLTPTVGRSRNGLELHGNPGRLPKGRRGRITRLV